MKKYYLILISLIFVLLYKNKITYSSAQAKPSGMAYVPAGRFVMGNNRGKHDEGPAHEVSLDGFYIDIYEVTNFEYSRFVKSEKRKPSRFSGDVRFNKPDYPVVGIRWDDAMAYCEWRDKRLPTEAEWEKAARGTDNRMFTWGNRFNPGAANISSASDPFPFTSSVGRFPAGASPYGIMDMLGNVWEWCSDWYDKDYYKIGIFNNPKGPYTGKLKVLRGGSWFNDKEIIRVTKRYKSSPINRSQTYGFRCAKDAAGEYL